MAIDSDFEHGPTLRRTLRRHVRVDLPLHCEECGLRWDDPADRWRVYFTLEEPPQPAVYCPACARREFTE